jgi:hypothetical protein
MKQVISGHRVPEASICINKSRLKLYNKESGTPTYYLNNGQEFQIELFNPTQNTILAKIEINGNSISQGGLILKPAERVFLERYLDVAKKFLFETYQVSNTEEVKQAIQHNGGIKIQFFNESIPQQITTTYPSYGYPNVYYYNNLNQPIGSVNNFYSRSNIGTNSPTFDDTGIIPVFGSASASLSDNISYNCNLLTDESLSLNNKIIRGTLSKKSIETGRVESGSHSDQQFKYVDKTFDYFAFHTIEYKLLPVSQKVNTTKDINVGQHCTNCGAKRKSTHRFCANCGKKL